ncbi:MAG: hypothetical protein HQ481_19635 [Alphaproteobacteria bacterium]|nr:hypothetical protein [Alphaproteobacteria bacterium]
MIRRLGAALLLATAMIILAATATDTAAGTVQKRFYLQVHNVKAGESLRLEVTTVGVLGILITDVRLGGIVTHLDAGEVAVDGTVLTVSTSRERLSVNLTLQAICDVACPAELAGIATVPTTSYAMLRTQAADATLTTSGGWRVMLSDG